MNSKFDRLRNGNNPVGALDALNGEESSNQGETVDTQTKSTKSKKIRRSFMLTDKQIRMLNKTKVNHPNVNITLSDIVGAAIEQYCNPKKDKTNE